MVVGVAVLAIMVTLLLIALILQRDGGTASPTPTPSTSASGSPAPSASAPSTGSPGASASASGSAAESPAVGGLVVGDFVEAIVSGVTLRQEPTTAGTRIGRLAQGSVSYVVEGPTAADGYQWYRLSAVGVPPGSGCITPLPTDPLECPIWFGWAAAADPSSAEPWFAAADVTCPDPATETADYMALPQVQRLGCYGAEPITFLAWWPAEASAPAPEACEGVDGGVAWLYCAQAVDIAVMPDETPTAAMTTLFLDPASGVTMPDRGQWVEVTGAYDHSTSAGCAEAERAFATEPEPDRAVLDCRARLVPTAVTPAAAP